MVVNVSAEDLIAQAAARFDSGNGEGEELAQAALARLAYRRRHGGKECDRCRVTKPVGAFGVDSREPDGLLRICRKCVALRDAAAYRERLKARSSS